MALVLARPAFALVDGADLDFNAYNKKVNAGPGAFYPLIKSTFYDGSGNLRQTYGGDYSGDDVSEELPGKTPVEFISAYDMENDRELLGYCYRENGSEYYDIYARIGGKAEHFALLARRLRESLPLLPGMRHHPKRKQKLHRLYLPEQFSCRRV